MTASVSHTSFQFLNQGFQGRQAKQPSLSGILSDQRARILSDQHTLHPAAASVANAVALTADGKVYVSRELERARKLRKVTREKVKRSKLNDKYEELNALLSLGRLGGTRVEKRTILEQAMKCVTDLRMEQEALVKSRDGLKSEIKSEIVRRSRRQTSRNTANLSSADVRDGNSSPTSSTRFSPRSVTVTEDFLRADLCSSRPEGDRNSVKAKAVPRSFSSELLSSFKHCNPYSGSPGSPVTHQARQSQFVKLLRVYSEPTSVPEYIARSSRVYSEPTSVPEYIQNQAQDAVGSFFCEDLFKSHPPNVANNKTKGVYCGNESTLDSQPLSCGKATFFDQFYTDAMLALIC